MSFPTPRQTKATEPIEGPTWHNWLCHQPLALFYVLNLEEIGLGTVSHHIREAVSYRDFHFFLPKLFLRLAHRRHRATYAYKFYITRRVSTRRRAFLGFVVLYTRVAEPFPKTAGFGHLIRLSQLERFPAYHGTHAIDRNAQYLKFTF